MPLSYGLPSPGKLTEESTKNAKVVEKKKTLSKVVKIIQAKNVKPSQSTTVTSESQGNKADTKTNKDIATNQQLILIPFKLFEAVMPVAKYFKDLFFNVVTKKNSNEVTGKKTNTTGIAGVAKNPGDAECEEYCLYCHYNQLFECHICDFMNPSECGKYCDQLITCLY